MRIEQLGLTIGDALQIQIGDNAEQRYPVRFYGFNSQVSVMVSAPSTGKDKMIFLREGTEVTLRFVANNVASGFTTRVLLTRGQPYPYLHLKVPKEIETVEVRKEARISTDTAVTAINKTLSSPAFPCQILNMSCSGCLIESTTKLAHKGELVNLTMKLKVGDIEPLVTADAEVTYTKEEGDDKFLYGLNIQSIDDEDIVTLRAFVYQELLRNMHML